jgi:carboxypeptidase family protein
MRRLFSLIAAAFLIVLAVPILVAQEQTASIEGTITDQSGSALPGVTVEAVSANGQRFTAQSDKEGHYRFPSVPPGVYTVTATLSGLQTAVLRRVEVSLGQAPKADLTLKPRMAESITVTAEAPIVDVTSSAAAASIRSDTIEKLPRGRDFASVVVQAAAANQNSRAGGIMIDGASGSENRFIMDGVDTTDPRDGTQGKVLVTDFVDEVQVKSAGYAAEFGGATGGVINAITKTGTNELKGSAGGYYNDRSWGGSPRPILQTQLTNSTAFEQFVPRKDKFTDFEPSFTLGGPILRDRLWFYGGYEPWIQSTTRTVDFFNSNGTIRTTRSFDQDFRRDNWVGTLSGSGGSKLIYKGTYNNSGYKTEKSLPSVTGRGSENANYSPGNKFENWTASGYADFVASPQWFFSAKGGRFYNNFTTSPTSTDVRVTFSGSPGATLNGVRVFPEIPDNLIQASGYANIPTNSFTAEDSYQRDNFNFDASWFPQFAGNHRIKAGIQFANLRNNVSSGQQNYLVDAVWNGTCSFCSTRGKYGTASVSMFQTTGAVESKNTGLFIQDSWTTLNDRLTLNIGVRSEEEKVPAYNYGQGVPITGKYAINFPYKDKLAPRLGFSYDILGNGRSKAYGSYGKFYDITKMEMPRGSFGGEKWILWPFSLDSFDWTQWDKCTNVTNDPAVIPKCPGMTLQGGGVNLRNSANSADLNLVDPNLKPMEQREISLGYQHELSPTMAAGFRYVNKHLVRAIEDVGVHIFLPSGSETEEFFIANPGEGVAQKILEKTGCTTCPAMPRAKRDYQGYEFEFTKRFTRNWSAHLSYVYSKLEGNYSGLANSDEAAGSGTARRSPNVNRIFDSLFMLFDQNGREVEGNLGGDRPHQAKAQVAYQFPFGTTLGVNEYYYSGVPGTTEMRFQGAPLFAFNRGDLGRTPNITQTDLNIQHELRLGRYGVSLGAIVLNLFDQKGVMNVNPVWSTTSLLLRDLSACGSGDVSVAACGPSANTPVIGGNTAGAARNLAQAQAFFKGFDAKRQRERQVALGLVPSPTYNQPNAYQDPREVRVFVRFIF